MDKDLLDILTGGDDESQSALLHEPAIDYVTDDLFDDAEDGILGRAIG